MTNTKLAMLALALLSLVAGALIVKHDAGVGGILLAVGGKLIGLTFPEVGAKKDPPSSGGGDPDDTVRIVPPSALQAPSDRSRLHDDIPDEPAEMSSFEFLGLQMRRHGLTLWAGGLLCCLAIGCSAFRSVTPADRAQGYAAEAKSVGLACKAYAFDLASGLVVDVPAMTKLCAGGAP